jgi:hypothetical protein
LAPVGLIERSEVEAENMAFTREQLRESFERAGFDEHWQALNRFDTSTTRAAGRTAASRVTS